MEEIKMGLETIIYFILGTLLSIIGFFLKSLYGRLIKVEDKISDYQKSSDLVATNLVSFKESVDHQYKTYEKLFDLKIESLNKSIEHLAKVIEKLEDKIS